MIPDPIERLEMQAEAIADELYHHGQWHCCECKTPIPEGQEETLSANPYAPPVCPECFEKAVLEKWGPDALKQLNKGIAE